MNDLTGCYRSPYGGYRVLDPVVFTPKPEFPKAGWRILVPFVTSPWPWNLRAEQGAHLLTPDL